MSTFEDNLWRELVHEHQAEQAHPGRANTRRRSQRRRLAGASLGLAGVATAAAVALSAGTAAPAFAVTSNSNGTVTVTITEITGIAGANAQLAALGVRARAVPIVEGCTATLHLLPKTPPPTDGSGLQSPPKSSSGAPQSTPPQPGPPQSITIEPNQIPAGDTLVLAAEPSTNAAAHGIQMLEALAQGPAPACVAQATGGKELP